MNWIPPKWGRKTIQLNGKDVETDFVDREGSILIEAAKAVPDSERNDWEQKIRMGLGFNDYGQILAGLRSTGKFKLVHQHPTEGHTSTFAIEPGTEGSYKVTIAGKRLGDSENGFVNLFLNTADIASIVQLVEWAIPRTLGWDLV